MVYRQQNFLENLQNGVKYQDFDAITDALAPEIGLLASEDKPALVKAVQDAGISVPKDVEDKKLFKIVVEHLFDGNEKLITNTLKSIVINKKKKESAEYSNAADPVSAIAEGIGGLANMGASIANAVAAKKTAAATVEAAKEANKGKMADVLGKIVDAKSGAAKAAVGAKTPAATSSKMLYIGLGVVGFIGICVVGYFALRTPTAVVPPTK